MKPDVDTLSTVPDAPPAAGPDRALDPPPPAALVEVLTAAVVDGDVAVGEDEPHPESPITPHINAAAMIHRLLLLESNLVRSELFMMAFLLVPNAAGRGSPSDLRAGSVTSQSSLHRPLDQERNEIADFR